VKTTCPGIALGKNWSWEELVLGRIGLGKNSRGRIDPRRTDSKILKIRTVGDILILRIFLMILMFFANKNLQEITRINKKFIF
jgi:hypothetical protein